MRPLSSVDRAMRSPFALLADKLVFRHFHIVEGQRAGIAGFLPQLAFHPGHPEPRRIVGHDERRDALLARIRIGHGEQDGGLADPGVADELLGPVDLVAPVALGGAGAHAAGVGTSARLGQGEAGHGVPGHRAEPAFLLGVGAVLLQYLAGRRVVDTDQGGHAAVAGRDFDQRLRVGQVVQLRPAPAFADRGPEEPEFAQLGDDGRFDDAGGLAFGSGGRQPFLGEAPGGLDHQGAGAVRIRVERVEHDGPPISS